MRVLLLHNRYRQEGGEERAVRETAELLRGAGHEVELLERDSAAAGRRVGGRGAVATALVRGGAQPEEVGEAVRRFGAEVVHAHNLQPLYGWRALAAAQEAGARTVLHLHNFRLFCAIGVAYRDGEVCHDCAGGRTWPGVVHRCRGGVGEAAAYAVGLARGWWRLTGYADELVAVSAATASGLRELGVDREISALANFAVPASLPEEPSPRAHALVAGRLVEEKGFDTAVEACRVAGVRLVVAGEGPDRERLRALAGRADVRFTGWVPEDELARLRADALAVLVPSRWEEPCPYVALDALAAGVPVLGSEIGGLPELLAGQQTLAPRAVDDWAQALRELRDDAALWEARSSAALTAVRDRFGPERYLERLLALYRGEPRGDG